MDWAKLVGADPEVFVALDWVRGQIQHQGTEAIAFRRLRPGAVPFWIWRKPEEFRIGQAGGVGEGEFRRQLAGRHLANSFSQVDAYVDALYAVLFALAEWEELNTVRPDTFPRV